MWKASTPSISALEQCKKGLRKTENISPRKLRRLLMVVTDGKALTVLFVHDRLGHDPNPLDSHHRAD